MQEYFETFENMRLIAGIPDSLAITLFVSGLKAPLNTLCQKDHMGLSHVYPMHCNMR